MKNKLTRQEREIMKKFGKLTLDATPKEKPLETKPVRKVDEYLPTISGFKMARRV